MSEPLRIRDAFALVSERGTAGWKVEEAAELLGRLSDAEKVRLIDVLRALPRYPPATATDAYVGQELAFALHAMRRGVEPLEALQRVAARTPAMTTDAE